ncbi:VanZ family protein [Aquiflexum sp.]|uniref:VanZ family protein n=1 Tax=Aquiflexum sp. TaxID=1872584 RepID=UPI0035939E05
MRIRRLIPAVLWLLMVSLAMFTPGRSLPKLPEFSFGDKLGHFLLFAVLSFLWLRVGTINEKRGINTRILITNLLVFCFIFPILAEYLQQFVPNRTFDYMDIVANLVGGAFGFIVFFILYKANNRLV